MVHKAKYKMKNYKSARREEKIHMTLDLTMTI